MSALNEVMQTTVPRVSKKGVNCICRGIKMAPVVPAIRGVNNPSLVVLSSENNKKVFLLPVVIRIPRDCFVT